MPRGVLDQVAHQAQRGLHRVDPRAARDEFLQDVVLRRGDDAVACRALLVGDGEVHGRDRRGHAVDRQRHADPIERDAGERLLHVRERVDRHADAPHLAVGAWVVGIQPELRRQIEGDVQRILSVSHQVFEPRVRLRRRAEADVLAHRPQPVAVHVLVDAAREGILAGATEVALDVATRHILGTVDRLDGKPGVRFDLSHQLLPASRTRATTHGGLTRDPPGTP